MSAKTTKSEDIKNLTRRYLIWCYKTTKEDYDKVERRYTQLSVDFFLRDEYKKLKKGVKSSIKQHLYDFDQYIEDKEEKGRTDKFDDQDGKHPKTEFLYLEARLDAIEKAIVHFLGAKALKEVKLLYETEMTNRILQARDHS